MNPNEAINADDGKLKSYHRRLAYSIRDSVDIMRLIESKITDPKDPRLTELLASAVLASVATNTFVHELCHRRCGETPMERRELIETITRMLLSSLLEEKDK